MGTRLLSQLAEREAEQKRMDEQNAIDRVAREERVRHGRMSRLGLPEPSPEWPKSDYRWVI